MTNISKGLVLLVVVLLVTSISANMVAAVRVNDDTTPQEDGEFNQYTVDDPNAINKTSYNERLTPSRYSPLQSGETVIVTDGDNLAMPSSWSCEPTDSVVILSYDSIACA